GESESIEHFDDRSAIGEIRRRRTLKFVATIEQKRDALWRGTLRRRTVDRGGNVRESAPHDPVCVRPGLECPVDIVRSDQAKATPGDRTARRGARCPFA